MPFADELIGVPTARALAAAIQAAAPHTDLPALRAAAEKLAPLSLRERSDLLRDALLTDLPGDYETFAGVIRSAQAGPESFTGWLIWPVTSAIAVKAITAGTAMRTRSCGARWLTTSTISVGSTPIWWSRQRRRGWPRPTRTPPRSCGMPCAA